MDECKPLIVGVHDQGWKERPIFGKIRFMVGRLHSSAFRLNLSTFCGIHSVVLVFQVTIQVLGGSEKWTSVRPCFMAYSGCEKKFKIADYITRVNELVAGAYTRPHFSST